MITKPIVTSPQSHPHLLSLPPWFTPHHSHQTSPPVPSPHSTTITRHHLTVANVFDPSSAVKPHQDHISPHTTSYQQLPYRHTQGSSHQTSTLSIFAEVSGTECGVRGPTYLTGQPLHLHGQTATEGGREWKLNGREGGKGTLDDKGRKDKERRKEREKGKEKERGLMKGGME
ncbi:hypothetical protein Pcinc_024907 [Petrolisthes cinctipes]|uniref:Uncharacterized protein n=1 Tax=Petrolisthes cinctipes TaxID=88211 RepID=A0AAE1FAB9_PETCI|nr:hypothetical protein Pcinc_024907 [Petrolisthes cinctipes]